MPPSDNPNPNPNPDNTSQHTGRAADPYAPRLPDAVRRAARRAEELQAEMTAETPPEAAEGGENPPEVSDRPDENRPFQAPENPPNPPSQPQQQDDWQNRYRTLQGKYDHEVPQLRGRVQQLEQLIAAMQVQAQPAQPAQPQHQPDLTEEIPEEDYTTYGPDFVDSTRRWARAELAPVVKNLQQQVAELRGARQQDAGDRLKDRVRTELDRDPALAGVWQQLDTDPGFNQWLEEYDQFSGNRRLDMLRAAYAGGDAVRTGRFFKAYLQEHTETQRLPTGQPSQTPPPVTRSPYTNGGNGHYGNGAGTVDLAAFAAPGRASNATPGPGAPERRIWTNRDIQAFYDGRLKGRFRGREDEADRMERDILAAAAEGRIRNE